eukprot:9503884-Pyramimonas_sp.AAC.3
MVQCRSDVDSASSAWFNVGRMLTAPATNATRKHAATSAHRSESPLGEPARLYDEQNTTISPLAHGDI